ncbi:MAG: hypothetical protein H6867_09720 [Rhodospirillales bacterium]|nr:hypothetical protein [Rhodospirillales bacterium]MCB9995941.1 hypothetical protein [Rhodospirillales bacterium]
MITMHPEWTHIYLGRKALCHHFRVASAEDMGDLGKAFAQALVDFRRHSKTHGREITIGIKATPGTGKTSFIQGILDCFPNKTSVESASGIRPQNIWNCGRKGWIRNYDAKEDNLFTGLPSYLRGTSVRHKHGLPFIDLIEHPAEDKIHRRFNALVLMNRTDIYSDECPRDVTFVVMPSQTKGPGFQKFLKQAAPFAVKP